VLQLPGPVLDQKTANSDSKLEQSGSNQEHGTSQPQFGNANKPLPEIALLTPKKPIQEEKASPSSVLVSLQGTAARQLLAADTAMAADLSSLMSKPLVIARDPNPILIVSPRATGGNSTGNNNSTGNTHVTNTTQQQQPSPLTIDKNVVPLNPPSTRSSASLFGTQSSLSPGSELDYSAPLSSSSLTSSRRLAVPLSSTGLPQLHSPHLPQLQQQLGPSSSRDGNLSPTQRGTDSLNLKSAANRQSPRKARVVPLATEEHVIVFHDGELSVPLRPETASDNESLASSVQSSAQVPGPLLSPSKSLQNSQR
jgi:hypothetical protein